MEIILALIATLLAIIFGFLSIRAIFRGGSRTSANNSNNCAVVKEGMAAESRTPIHKCVHPPEEKATNKMKAEPNLQTEQNSTQKKATQNSECYCHGDKSIDDASDIFINAHDLDLLSTSEGNAKPIKVKEFIRSLRENHMEDMTEEEIEQENRVKKQQLQEIFQLMQSSQNQYGIDSYDDMEEQMRLYAIKK